VWRKETSKSTYRFGGEEDCNLERSSSEQNDGEESSSNTINGRRGVYESLTRKCEGGSASGSQSRGEKREGDRSLSS